MTALAWRKGSDYHVTSEPPGHTIAKAIIVPGRIVYTAFRGDVALHYERDLDPADEAMLIAAMRRCKAACDV